MMQYTYQLYVNVSGSISLPVVLMGTGLGEGLGTGAGDGLEGGTG